MRYSKIKNILYWCPLLCLFFYSLLKAYHFLPHDFANYYFGAYFLNQQLFSEIIYDALHFNQQIADLSVAKVFAAYHPNTPFLAFFFQPMLLFPPDMFYEAKLFFNLLSIIIFTYFLYKLFVQYKICLIYILLLPFLFFFPIKSTIEYGQVYFLIFALLAGGLLCFEKKQIKRASFCWSVAAMLKVFPIFIFLFLVLKKHYQTALWMVVWAIVLGILSLSLVPINTWLFFVFDVLPNSSNGVLYDGFTPAAKSALMLFKNLFLYHPVLNTKPFIHSSFLFFGSMVLYKTLVISLIISIIQQKNISNLACFSACILGAMLFTPNSSTYSMYLLIFPLLALIQRQISKKCLLLFTLLILLVANLPMHVFYKTDLPIVYQFPRVYLLIGILLLFTYHFLQYFSFKTPCITLAFFGLTSINLLHYQSDDKNTFVLSKKSPILLTDYSIKEDTLVYSYWGINGEIEQKTDFFINHYDPKKIQVINNQIYFKNQKLTNSKENKRKAVLIEEGTNKTAILYLSDKDRGMGFYTLRRLPLTNFGLR